MEAEERTPRGWRWLVAALWVGVLVRLLCLAADPNRSSTGVAENLGYYAGKVLIVAIVMAVCFAVMALASRGSGKRVRLRSVLTGTTIVVLLLGFGGLYARVKSRETSAPPAPTRELTDAEVGLAPAAPVLDIKDPYTQSQPDYSEPATEGACYTRFVAGRPAGKPRELLQQLCTSAFDATEHPIARARFRCLATRIATSASPGNEVDECLRAHPLPACPSSMKYNLDHSRCE